MVAPPEPVGRLTIQPTGREYELPGPITLRPRQLARDGLGQLDRACPPRQVPLMHGTYRCEVPPQWSDHTIGKHGGPVLPTLASAHGDLATGKVHVLDPERQAFEQAESAAVHEHRREL